MKTFTLFAMLIATLAANAQSWNYVGSRAFSPNEADYESIGIDTNGTPYLVYTDFLTNFIVVMKFDGAAWAPVGPTSVYGYNGVFATDHGNNLYIAYVDNGSGTASGVVQKYNGSSWATLGATGLGAGGTTSMSMAIGANDTPYVCYSDLDTTCFVKTSVMKFDGSSWVYVGEPRFAQILVSGNSFAVFGSIPYLAFVDSNGKATAMTYKDTGWVILGAPGFSAGTVSEITLAVDPSGTPYVGYTDDANGEKGTVMKYNGTSWVNAGPAGFTPGQADAMSITMDGSGNPYVVFEDSSSTHYFATVMKYDGSSWGLVGNLGFSEGFATYLSISIDRSGTPYVGYQDLTVGRKASVMKYVSPPTVVPKINNGAFFALDVFPNPSNGSFTLLLSSSQNESASISITNILGEVVKEQTVATNLNVSVQFDAAPGIYFLTANTPEEKQTVEIEVK